MIHMPAYWSFDPKRDNRRNAIAKTASHSRPRPPGFRLSRRHCRTEQNAEKGRQLDQEVRRLGLKGDPKHEFICRGLDWDVRTSPKRISRLRAEFKK
jgi:hypothetical protein